MRKSFSDSPPRFIDDSSVYVEKKNKNNNNILVKESCRNMEGSSIRRSYDHEDAGWDTETEMDHNNAENKEPEADIETPEDNMEGLDETIKVKTEILDEGDMPEIEETPHMCTLTPEHLEMENLRVLTAMGGLFYAGQLHAVQPPDVYSITLDGERGNRPHIMSREEILRDAIVEIAPKSTEELEPGTRLCAYWSQQYRCLYPGSVAEPETPNPEFDSKFVAVEFDDGDSGTIILDDIRLLPANYPVMEYDPNPLLSLSKRKRRTSSSTTSNATERRPTQISSIEETQELELIPIEVKAEPQEDEESHKERKRLKKKKKEKIKLRQVDNEKKKRKKRKHSQDESKHKKHRKKHRKHKKNHHDKEESSSRTSDEKTESDGSSTLSEEQTSSQEQVNSDASEEMEPSSTVQEEDTREEEYINVEENIIVEESTSDSSGYVEERMIDEEEDIPQNPEDEVTMDDILEVLPKTKKIRDRQASIESSRSKMSAFLPARQLWSWSGKATKRARGKGRAKRQYYKSIQRENELIEVGNSAVFLSTGRPDRPYIGCIKAMWEQGGKMIVKVQWFYHPEETASRPKDFRYPGALFESNHTDENEVQTISHKCEVLPLHEYIEALGNDPDRFATIYQNNDIYYRAGKYDAITTVLEIDENIPFGPQTETLSNNG
ncbi:hypothetical protein WA026_001619 [Henosepilachna vigintioctopunctata]|uniref:BAH domain-containing protein n=1 Tax=Henosepilachna vigintioctopunctata TaxID=420089 RepID=A0AAW1UTX6_9CUCU